MTSEIPMIDQIEAVSAELTRSGARASLKPGERFRFETVFVNGQAVLWVRVIESRS